MCMNVASKMCASFGKAGTKLQHCYYTSSKVATKIIDLSYELKVAPSPQHPQHNTQGSWITWAHVLGMWL